MLIVCLRKLEIFIVVWIFFWVLIVVFDGGFVGGFIGGDLSGGDFSLDGFVLFIVFVIFNKIFICVFNFLRVFVILM